MNTELFSRTPTGKILSHAIHDHFHATAGLTFIADVLEKTNNDAIDIKKMRAYIKKANDSLDYAWSKLKELHDTAADLEEGPQTLEYVYNKFTGSSTKEELPTVEGEDTRKSGTGRDNDSVLGVSTDEEAG